MNETASTKSVIIIVLILLLTVGAGYLASGLSHHSAYLGYMMGAVGIISFFSVLWLGCGREGLLKVTEKAMRKAIAASMVIVYLLLLSTAIFVVREGEELSELAKKLLSNFTWVIGVIVVFYFGSSAYIEVKQNKKGNNGE